MIEARGLFRLAVFCCAAHCSGGQWNAIPSDAAKASPVEKQRFLTAICPGHATRTGFSVCPPEMPLSSQTWDLRTITYGHFLTPKSEDALVSGIGCEPHSNLMSGAFLFTRDGASWRKIRYSPGTNTDDCKKLISLDGRDLLVCEASDMHQGVGDSFLYLTDVGEDPQSRKGGSPDIFFGVDDSLGSCVKLADGMTVSGAIESVSFVPAAAKHSVKISVVALLGRAVIPAEVLQHCQPARKGDLEMRTVRLRYNFFFDGHRVLPDDQNPPTRDAWAIAPETSYRAAK